MTHIYTGTIYALIYILTHFYSFKWNHLHVSVSIKIGIPWYLWYDYNSEKSVQFILKILVSYPIFSKAITLYLI